jgi:ABC-type multidrug transport system ATPase subunit/ABC-type multidrug transport system permease subunit
MAAPPGGDDPAAYAGNAAFLCVVLVVGGVACTLCLTPPARALLLPRDRGHGSAKPSPLPLSADAPAPAACTGFRELSFAGVTAVLPRSRWRGGAERGGGGERRVLHGVCGAVRSGELVALVGPSGGGKSTLLSYLAGEPSPLRREGDVRVDGARSAAEARRRRFGFVRQGDAQCDRLTAREAVLFSASLRLPDAGRAAAAADEALRELSLAHVAHTRVTRLSGGERRRVTIACELCLSPPLLLCDEPTSGLDAYSALLLVRTLGALARTGRAVLLAVHQPSAEAFALFDRTLLLAGGRVLWHGSGGGDGGASAAAFFAAAGAPCPPQRTLAEHLLFVAADPDLLSVLTTQQQPALPGALVDAAPAADDGPQPAVAAPASVVSLAPLTRQLRMLLWRELLQVARAPWLLVAHLLLALGIAVWLGVVYFKLDLSIIGFQNRLGVVFFMCAFFGLSALSACDALVGERPLLRAEARRFYHPAAYVAAKLLVDAALLRVLPTLVHACVIYHMIGFQRGGPKFGVFLAALELNSLATAALAFLVSAASPNVGVANLGASFIFLQSAVFGGLLTNTATLPAWLAWLRYTSMMFYTFETVVANEFDGRVFSLGLGSIQGLRFSGGELASALALDVAHVGPNLLCLLAWLLFFAAAAAGLMTARHH